MKGTFCGNSSINVYQSAFFKGTKIWKQFLAFSGKKARKVLDKTDLVEYIAFHRARAISTMLKKKN